MKFKEIAFIWFFSIGHLVGQDVSFFQSVKFNITYLDIKSFNNEIYAVGRNMFRDSSTIVTAVISNYKKLKWQAEYTLNQDLYPQDIITGDSLTVILIQTTTNNNFKKGIREESHGVILCYDKSGKLLWNKKMDNIPISGVFAGNGNILISFLRNVYDPMVQELNSLGCMKLDRQGNEQKSIVFNESINYEGGVFMEYLKNENKTVFFFNSLNKNYRSPIKVKKIEINDSLLITNECVQILPFLFTSKIKFNGKDAAFGGENNRKIKRAYYARYLNCQDSLNGPNIFTTESMIGAVDVFDKYFSLQQAGVLSIYEIEGNDIFKLVFKQTYEDYNYYGFSMNTEGKILAWFITRPTDSKNDFHKLGVMTIDINRQNKEYLKK